MGGIIAVGQRVHHSRRALRATVTRIAAEPGEGDRPALAKLDGRLVHEEPDLEVAGVVAQSDRRAVLGANPALGAQDQVLVPAEVGWVPPHAGVLRPAEDIAARQRAEHLRRERQLSRGTLRIGPYLEDRSIIRCEESVHPLPVWLIRGNRHGKPDLQQRHAASRGTAAPPPLDLIRRAHFYPTKERLASIRLRHRKSRLLLGNRIPESDTMLGDFLPVSPTCQPAREWPDRCSDWSARLADHSSGPA